MPPWEAPSNLKLVFSSEWQSPAQVAQIVQMLQRQMKQTLRPEVQVTDVTGPSDTTGNRARGQAKPMVTVAVKNIPLHYSQDMFMDQVKKHGFEGLFDLLYLPWNSQTGTNKGLGFVNFIKTHDAQRFQKDMEGKYLEEESGESGLPLQIERADVQGLKSNRARFARINKNSDFGHHGPWLAPTKHQVPLLEIGQWAGIPRRRKESQSEPSMEV